MDNKQKQILDEHKYAIFQGKDGRWRTSVPDNTKKNNRRLIAKSTKEKLEKAIIDHYISQEINNERNIQLSEMSLLADTSGIRINKNSFEYRKSLNGKQISFNSNNIETILKIKEYVDNKIKRAGIITDMGKIKQNDNVSKYIYFVSNGSYCKIGIASNLKKRMSDLQVGNTSKLDLLYYFQTTDYDNIENQLHKLFEPFKVSGEWYDILFLFKQKTN